MVKKHEQTNLFEDLSTIRNQYLLCQKEKNSTYEKMQKELEETERKIKDSYQEKIDSVKKQEVQLKNKLELSKKLLEGYSTFNTEMIGNVVAKLVSLLEGEVYIFQQVTHKTFGDTINNLGVSYKETKKLAMIVKENKKKRQYYDSDRQHNVVNNLIANNEALLLSENVENDEKITFYTAKEGLVQCLGKVHNFSYVEDFITLVVKYRTKNHSFSITEKELLSLLGEFILSKREMIEERVKKRVLEKEEQLKQQLLAEQEMFANELEKIEFEALIESGLPNRHNNTLLDRLKEKVKDNNAFKNTISNLEIVYEGLPFLAKMLFDNPSVSSENIFIAKFWMESSVRCFDNAECSDDIIADDGLVGIVDISHLKQSLDNFVNLAEQEQSGRYKVEKINEDYLRILYLPNKGTYQANHSVLQDKKKPKTLFEAFTMYRTEWDIDEEAKEMLDYLQKIELLSNFTEKQMQFYKQIKGKQ